MRRLPSAVALVNRRRRLQITLLPFAFHDPLPNLGGSLALLVHGVGVIHLFQANRTLGAMRALEAAVQTVVSHTAIAVAIARLLMQYCGNLGGQLIGMGLEGILGIRSPELLLSQNSRKGGPLGWRTFMISRRPAFLLGGCPGSGYGKNDEG